MRTVRHGQDPRHGRRGFHWSHTVESLLRKGRAVAGLDNLRAGRLKILPARRAIRRFVSFKVT